MQDPVDIEAVALLDEPARRTLYQWVIGAGHAVGRDEAATAVGVSRALAAFHLDRLAGAGLLVAEYRRLSGRTGPGAGRPAKLYRRGPRDIVVSLPERRYEVPASLFAEAITRMSGPEPPEALRAAANEAGAKTGSAARERVGPRPSRKKLRNALREALDHSGYESFEAPSGEIWFRNCPFHALVDEHRELVCGMNLALVSGLLDGLRDDQSHARFEPQPNRCCVAISAVEKARPLPVPREASSGQATRTRRQRPAPRASVGAPRRHHQAQAG